MTDERVPMTLLLESALTSFMEARSPTGSRSDDWGRMRELCRALQDRPADKVTLAKLCSATHLERAFHKLTAAHDAEYTARVRRLAETFRSEWELELTGNPTHARDLATDALGTVGDGSAVRDA